MRRKAQKEQFDGAGHERAEWVAKAMQEDNGNAGYYLQGHQRSAAGATGGGAVHPCSANAASEGGAKIVNNLDVYRKALEMVSDPSLYTGSMERSLTSNRRPRRPSRPC